MAAPDPGRERAALGKSISAATVLGAGGVVAGIVTGSQIILLDGVYAFIGVAVSWLLLLTSRIVGGGSTSSYPYGREALTPLVVGIQGFVLLATVGYAALDAVGAIAEGGTEVAAGWAFGYAAITTAASAAVWRYLLREARGSDLVEAEVAAWFISVVLGVAMMAGFLAIELTSGSRWNPIAPYIDPLMVLATAVVLVPSPIRMVRSTFVELLEGLPSVAVQAQVMEAIEAIRRDHGLAEPVVRMTKVGPKLYVEVDGAADPSLSIAQEHAVRMALQQRLNALSFDVWLNLELFPGDVPPE